jgi:Spy/CpxP family protein refolding chaperone
MKRFSLMAAMLAGALCLGGTVVTAQAQDATARKEVRKAPSIEQQLERIAKQLDLTDAQKPKVKAVLEETNKKRQSITATGSERREKMTALMTEQDKQLKTILTTEQYDKLLKQREEMKQKAKNRGTGEGKRKKTTSN